MSEQDGLNPAEQELEEALKSLAPAAARIDPVSAAFEAGRRSVRTQLHVWRMATAAALLIGVGGLMLPRHVGVGPNIQSGMQVAVHRSAPELAPPLAAQSVFRLQAAVREHGIAGLPPTRLPAVGSGRPSDVL
jgi:hypothetical protein